MARPRLDPEVTKLLDEHDHPLREAIEALREIVLAADATIVEGVKWNTASYRTTEWFATVNGPKQTKEPMLVLHAGAKAKGKDLQGRIADPTSMLRWLGKDRALVTFVDRADVTKRRTSLQALLRSWLEHL